MENTEMETQVSEVLPTVDGSVDLAVGLAADHIAVGQAG